jgi:hypothetical protein
MLRLREKLPACDVLAARAVPNGGLGVHGDAAIERSRYGDGQCDQFTPLGFHGLRACVAQFLIGARVEA